MRPSHVIRLRLATRSALPRARRTTAIATIALTSVVLSSCGSSTPSTATSPSPSASSAVVNASNDAATQVGADGATPNSGGTSTDAPEALQFTASLVGGQPLDGTTLANGQPVLFWFWSPF